MSVNGKGKCDITHTHTHTHTGTMQHYSAIRKKELLPFVMTWMKLEDIIL